jgi:hypothetical protein
VIERVDLDTFLSAWSSILASRMNPTAIPIFLKKSVVQKHDRETTTDYVDSINITHVLILVCIET